MIPNTSKYTPPVSHYIPLVSAIPLRTLSRRLGVKPAWSKALSRRARRKPVEAGFFQFLVWLLSLPVMWPFIPAQGIDWLRESLDQQATEEQDVEKRLKEERLSLEMRREMGEITEADYKRQMAEIDRKIREIKGPSK